MGDMVSVECSQLLYFPGGVGGDTPLGVVEFAGDLQVPTCCRFWDSPAT